MHTRPSVHSSSEMDRPFSFRTSTVSPTRWAWSRISSAVSTVRIMLLLVGHVDRDVVLVRVVTRTAYGAAYFRTNGGDGERHHHCVDFYVAREGRKPHLVECLSLVTPADDDAHSPDPSYSDSRLTVKRESVYPEQIFSTPLVHGARQSPYSE